MAYGVGYLETQFVVVAEADLSSIVEPVAQVRFGVEIEDWQLPEADRLALVTWGLPDGPLLKPAPRTDREPVLVPNLASDIERRLLEPEDRLYGLGTYGADYDPELTIQVGAVAGSGQVMGIRRRPVTTDDIAVPLRPYHPNLYHPAVHYCNQSVSAFVEVAWRWRAAVELLRAYAEPPYDAPVEEHERHAADIERACQTFLDRMTRLDPTLGDDSLDSLWIGTITEDL